MKISFVIPAYNEGALIGSCIRSILRAIEAAAVTAEIIVVDNASTDRTADVAATFPGVRVINEPRKSTSRARQAGYLASKGELIANIDADNELPSGWIATVMSTFNREPGLVCLMGPTIYHDLPFITRWSVHVLYYYLGYASWQVMRLITGKGVIAQGGNCVIRRSALDQVGGYDLAYDFYGDDVATARRLQSAGKVKFTFRLPIYGSGRRIAATGFFTMAYRYAINYVWTVLFGRALTKDARAVRSPYT